MCNFKKEGKERKNLDPFTMEVNGECVHLNYAFMNYGVQEAGWAGKNLLPNLYWKCHQS